MTNDDAAVLAAFDPWTADDAAVHVAQAAFERHGGSGPGPAHQSEVARLLLAFEHKVKAGYVVEVDPSKVGGGSIGARVDAEWDTGPATLEALLMCATAGLKAPPWLVVAARLRFESGQRSKLGWSDPASFGRPYPQRTRVELEPERNVQRATLYYVMLRFLELHPGQRQERLWEHFPGHRKSSRCIELNPHLKWHIEQLGLSSSDARKRFAEAESQFGRIRGIAPDF